MGECPVHDLAGWRKERMPERPSGIIEMPPDWVCEIVSPGHERKDTLHLFLLLQRRQVPCYWIIWPEDRVLIDHQLEGANYKVIATISGQSTARIPPSTPSSWTWLTCWASRNGLASSAAGDKFIFLCLRPPVLVAQSAYHMGDTAGAVSSARCDAVWRGRGGDRRFDLKVAIQDPGVEGNTSAAETTNPRRSGSPGR